MKTNKRISILAAGALLAAVALSACGAPGASSAAGQPTGSGQTDLPHIGVIQYMSHSSLDNCYQGLIEGLKEAGYEDGRTVTIEFQNAMGSEETASQLAKNMVARQYDLIVAIATPVATKAYAAARDENVPVLFCAVSDPVAAGLVQSLDKPGHNCTGTSDRLNIEGQLKMIRAFQPEAKTIGILYTTSEPNSVTHLNEIKKMAPQYGFTIEATGIQQGSEVAQAATVLAGKVDCITNFTDNNVVNNLTTLLAKANEANIPVYGSEIEQVTKGCLASESLDYVALGKETGRLAERVLKGEAAAGVPVGQVKDSFPVYNRDVLARFKLTVPDAYQRAQSVTTAAQ